MNATGIALLIRSALQDLVEAKHLQPDDKAVQSEYARVRKIVDQNFKKEATKYAKLFG